uniref:Uncharacterized protein n=1 Tax=Pristionchus pacificus TaxID=54126 RepID=A0A2A6B8J6_PRIPA|eukprot:PDM62199.1 hypothetical protein PRIPAC_51641 [Pristionchus pacificus]
MRPETSYLQLPVATLASYHESMKLEFLSFARPRLSLDDAAYCSFERVPKSDYLSRLRHLCNLVLCGHFIIGYIPCHLIVVISVVEGAVRFIHCKRDRRST